MRERERDQVRDQRMSIYTASRTWIGGLAEETRKRTNEQTNEEEVENRSKTRRRMTEARRRKRETQV